MRDDIENAIEETINRAEGNFLQRNATSTEKKQKKKAKKVNVIGEEQVKNALQILEKYKSGKANFNSRVVENEEWWKLRHWQRNNASIESDINPTSAWLFNSIMNKLADFSDNFPEPNIRARTAEDVKEAQRIKNVLPMILEATDFEQTYQDNSLAKVKNGTSVTGIFWNSNKDDIDIRSIDALSIYWEPGIKDIQASRNVFTIEMVDNEALKEQYPDIDLKKSGTFTNAKYLYEDNIDTEDKSAVIDWYYKRKGILHYCKFVNDDVLISTENDPETYPNGLYDDGEYPFVFDTLFNMEGAITGFGYIDVCKSPQEYIDRLDQAIIKNALMCAVPRYFKRRDSSVNDEQFLNWNNPLVECGNLNEEDLREIITRQLGSEIFNARDGKINELKQTSGNSDVNTGTTTQGVTAASAISQLIETGSKGSRLAIKGSYRAYRKIIYKIIERMRQFYDEPRYVRIVGDDGTEQFTTYSNQGLRPQPTQSTITGETYYRLPQFDIEVTAQKSNPYNKMSQNELALQFYQYQFFNPQNADATLAALDMMDFDHKEDVINKISQNGTMYDMIVQQQQMIQELQAQIQPLSALTDMAYPQSNLTGIKTQSPQQQPKGSKAEQLKERAASATNV